MGMEQQLLSPAPHALQRDRAALPGNVGMGRRAKVDGLQKNTVAGWRAELARACSGAAFCCQKCNPEGPSVDFQGGCAELHVS